MLSIIKRLKPYLIITLVVLISILLLWAPFLLKTPQWFSLNIINPSFDYIYKNYDGPLYLVVAKTFYNPWLIDQLHLEINTSPYYFAAHLPLYPLAIRLFALIFGYLQSMVLTNLIFTLVLAGFFFFLIKKEGLSQKPLLLTNVFLFLPRFYVVRSIGAPESLFILLILISLYCFEKEKYLWAGVLGGLATMTKVPAILLFPAYGITLLEKFIREKKIKWQSLAILLIPLSLLAVFGLYQKQYGNFFAYLNQESLVPLVFPFSVFNFQKKWVGTAWLEEIIFYFFIYLIALIKLRHSKYRSFFYFTLVFLTALTFVQHQDISRYALPLWPLACISFNKFFTSKEFKLALLILLPAIYLYAVNYLVFNILPISNWQAFL